MTNQPLEARRILVINDDIQQRRLLRTLLSPARYKVLEASSSASAFDLLRQPKPDLIILDLCLEQGAGGKQVLPRLRSDGRAKSVPILAIGSDSSLSSLAAAFDSGANELICRADLPSIIPIVERVLLEKIKDRDSDFVDVLHVEDDDEWADLVKIWMIKRGLRAHRVRSFAEMRTYLDNCQRPPRSLLMDLGLQDGDGLEALERIKKSPRMQSIPVVILTGRAVTSLECLERQALYRFPKDPGICDELCRTFEVLLTQQDRSQGMVSAGDLLLYPQTREVLQDGLPLVKLEPGRFAALHLLVRSSPTALADDALYHAFIERHPYKTADAELTVRQTVRNYISRLRRALGPKVGARISYIKGAGYAYRPPEALPTL